MNLDELILRRLRQPPPLDCTVVPASTPIIAFGRFRSAKVATISLNPSYREFDLVKGQHRFHTLGTLGVDRYQDLETGHRDKVLDYCERYFERPGIYYDAWFDRVEALVKSATNASYFQGTACHLDISQWATTEVWDNLSPHQRNEIASEMDMQLIRELIVHGPYEVILLNGSKTAKQVLKAFNLPYEKHILRPTERMDGRKRKNKVEGYRTTISTLLGSELNREVRLFGWNSYVKYAGADTLQLISDWVRAELATLR